MARKESREAFSLLHRRAGFLGRLVTPAPAVNANFSKLGRSVCRLRAYDVHTAFQASVKVFSIISITASISAGVTTPAGIRNRTLVGFCPAVNPITPALNRA